MKKLKHLPSAIVQILAAIVAIACILIPSYTIYQNLKKDFGIDGEGGIVLTQDCSHVGPWDNDYKCIGTYQQGSGMVEVLHAVVHVTGRHLKGEYVGDIYRDQSASADAPPSQQHYMSGDDRRSLLHNLLPFGIGEFGLVLLCWSLWPKRTKLAQQTT